MSCRRLPMPRIKRARRRERDVPANGCCNETTGIVIGSNPARGAGGRAARCAAAPKDLDNHHAAAAARAWRAMIGRGVRIGGVVRSGGSTAGIGAAISSLARAMLALQPGLASSP